MSSSVRFSTYLAVWITGASGLVFQVVWQRYLSRLLGNEYTATALVLAVFLFGLGMGYLLFGTLSRNHKNPILLCAILEGAAGIWGLLFPWIFAALDHLTGTWKFHPPLGLIGQGGLITLILLLPPTMCMGANIPLLTRAMPTTLDEATRVHSRIYALNTFGAFFGTLAAAYFLIPLLGLPQSLAVAGKSYLLAALLLWSAARKSAPLASAQPEPTAPPWPRRFHPAFLATMAALCGATTMLLENVLIRISGLSLGASTYSYALIVSVFILGIALGARLVGGVVNPPRSLLFVLSSLLAVLLGGLYFTLDQWPYYAHLLRVACQPNPAGFWAFQLLAFTALAVVLVPLSAITGAILPLLFHEARRTVQSAGWNAGILFAANLAGALVGSLGSLLLYEVTDNAGVFLSAAVLAAGTAVFASLPCRMPLRFAGIGLLIGALVLLVRQPGFDPHRFANGTFRLYTPMPSTFQGADAFYAARAESVNILSYDDRPEATVAVVASRSKKKPSDLTAPEAVSLEEEPQIPISIFVNGKSDSNTVYDARTIRLAAHLPALLAWEREKVLIIGLGTGVTAGEFTLYPDVRKIVVAEISKGVANALPYFSEQARWVDHDPRFEIRLGDAFRTLRRSDEQWDIIVSEPSNLWVQGVDQLFSQEFYTLVRSRLKPQGIFVQWMHEYSASREMLVRVANTFHSVFPNGTVFRGESQDLLLIGLPAPFEESDFLRIEARLEDNAAVRASLKAIRSSSIEEIKAAQEDGWLQVLSALPAEPETLDEPRLHYLAGEAAFVRGYVAPAKPSAPAPGP